MIRPQYHTLTVQEVIAETGDACSVVLNIPESLHTRFDYQPGQHLQLHVPHDGGMLPRCYSLSSMPQADEAHRITVKRVADGRASNWICDHLAAGDRIEVSPPAGVFTPRSLDADLLLLAGGSGITPVFSILRSVLARGRGHIRLIYANRDERSVIFADALRQLAVDHAHRLEIIHLLDSVQGCPSTTQLQALARGWERAECFICGPSAFMDAAAAALQANGVARARVHIERFVSLPANADALAEVEGDADAAAATAATDTGAAVDVAVHLDGEDRQLAGSTAQLLIDSMEAAGMAPPHSCRSGACGACMCQIEEGSVRHQANQVLDEHDLAEGWILPCQAVPTSARVRIRYPD